MDIIILLFLFVLITLLIIRSIKKYYLSLNNRKPKSKKFIVLKYVAHFFIKECKSLFYLYIGFVGLYVLIERMYKYNIYPANISSLKPTFLLIHNMNSNELIMELYGLSVIMYLIMVLPYRLIKLYDAIIKITDKNDFIHSFIHKNFKKLKKRN